jgi:hydrogenase nickel incorporation protein HypA/HybF
VHEFSIVQRLIGTVEEQASAAGARRVTQVKLKLNPLSGYTAEHIQFSFDLAKKPGSIVADAILALEQTAGIVRCENCGHEFEVEELPNLCPRCDSVKLQPKEAIGLVLESFEIEK